jgi:serine/threonine-protein kinase RsbW
LVKSSERASPTTLERTFEVDLPSEIGWEEVAADVVGKVAKFAGFPPDRVDDLRTAVGEAVANAIEHGNGCDPARRVHLVLVLTAGDLQLDVRDESNVPFQPAEGSGGPGSPGQRAAGSAPHRGWGIFLMHRLVDHVQFLPWRKGNTVRLTMRRVSGTRDQPAVGTDVREE